MTLAIGDRVKHPTQHEQWGPGEVLAVSPGGKVTVHFALVGKKILKGVALEKLSGKEAAHPLLENRKAATKRARSTRSFAEMKEAFLRLFPDGFYDPKYLDEERNYKLEAGALLANTLGRTELSALLQTGDHAEITRLAVAVMDKTNLVFPNEKMAFKAGLATERGRELFARALDNLLYGSAEYRPRFEAFTDILEQIGANKWPLATYYSFIAFPKEQMFLKPDVTKRAAEACNFELNYRVELNWWTYESLLRFTKNLEELISDLKPRDNIDMQSFIFCIGERV
jgi:Protein of unknown function (DUF3553)